MTKTNKERRECWTDPENPSPIVVVIHLETLDALSDFIQCNDAPVIQSIKFDREKLTPQQDSIRIEDAFWRKYSVDGTPDPNRGRIEELEGQVKILNEANKGLEKENTRLEQMKSSSLAAVIERRDALAKENTDQEFRIEELTEQNIELRAKIDALETENKRLRDQQPAPDHDPLNPPQRKVIDEIVDKTPNNAMNSRWNGLLLNDLTRYEIACQHYAGLAMQSVLEKFSAIAIQHDPRLAETVANIAFIVAQAMVDEDASR